MKSKIFVSAIFAITMSSCLDLNPISEIGEDTFYSNDTEVAVGLTGCYNGLQAPIKNEWMLTDIRSDVSRAYDKSSSKTEIKNVMALNELEAFASIQQIEQYWNSVYNNIYRCNMVLQNVGNVSNDAKRKQYEGEALFIRAYHYFNLVRLFGPIFWVDKPISAQEAFSYDRMAVERVYSNIEKDLLKIINDELLPEAYSSDSDLGRVTLLSARTLLGKLYLTQKKYAEAKTQLKAVETAYNGYDLSSIKYADVFSINNEMNKEIIFAIRFKAGNVGLGNPFGNMFAPLNSGTSVINGNGSSYNYPTTTLVNSYKDGDERKDATLGFGYHNNTTGLDVTIRYVKKYLSPVTTAEDGENDVPVLRYADVLLMLAEIENELSGPTAEALNNLNATVKRAGVTPFTIADLPNKVAFRLAVEEERFKEFAYENQRFFDLIRTGRYVDVMKKHYATEFDDKNNKSYYEDKPNLMAGNINLNQLLLPLPTSLIDVNPEIAQNPGY